MLINRSIHHCSCGEDKLEVAGLVGKSVFRDPPSLWLMVQSTGNKVDKNSLSVQYMP